MSPHQQRTPHHITYEEAELVDCFRLLHPDCQATIIAIIAASINAEKSPALPKFVLRAVDPS